MITLSKSYRSMIKSKYKFRTNISDHVIKNVILLNEKKMREFAFTSQNSFNYSHYILYIIYYYIILLFLLF